LLLGLGLLLGLVSAGGGCADKYRRMEGRYDLGDPGGGWSRVKAGGADRAWWHADLGASIYADSNCGPRYDDSPPAELAERLLFGVTDREAVSAQDGTLAGRDSHTARIRGRLDGVEVEVAATVVKKHFCVYDIVLIAPPSTFEAAWSAFEAARGGLEVR